MCDRPAPGFTADDRTLLSALSQHAHYSSVAEAAGIPVDIVSTEITDLVAKAAADNATHLVALAHRWQLLGHGHGLPRAKDRRDAEAEAARGRLVVSVVTCVLAVISVILAASVRPFA
ncbi:MULTISPECIES: hypothetical protein [unclassified Streptomyces]|uniref:hypothetical protein n=1 Tax=unclassified Streptomyces TaxID=2593676 RepID=UPI0037B9DC7D